MILEPSDVPNVIMDLYFFDEKYPNWKIPMRYLNILAMFLSKQLSNHPAVTDDVMASPVFVAPFDPMHLKNTTVMAKKAIKKSAEKKRNV